MKTLFLLLSALLVACGGPATTEIPTPPPPASSGPVAASDNVACPSPDADPACPEIDAWRAPGGPCGVLGFSACALASKPPASCVEVASCSGGGTIACCRGGNESAGLRCDLALIEPSAACPGVECLTAGCAEGGACAYSPSPNAESCGDGTWTCSSGLCAGKP